jgi:branched-chain amino acid transport system substrate-binding protein
MQRRTILRAAAGLACAPSAWAQSPNIVLGQSAALTGPASELGLQFRQGAQLHFDKVNAQGGIAGRKIELRSLDDGYEPERCVANTNKLIEGGAFALFGYVGTAPSLAALPLATGAQKLFLAPFTGSEALRIPFNPLAFHIRASYVDETNAIVEHLTSVGIKKIGVFYQNDSDGKAGLLGVSRALKLQYQAPAGLGKVERNSVDVAAAVDSILAARPDAIVQISTYRSCAAFVRAARKAGFGGVFYNISSVGTQALAQELQADSRGVVISQVMPFPFAPTSRLAGDYLAAGKEALGDKFDASYGSIEGYVAACTVAEALRRAGRNLSQKSVIAALESMREFDLGGFRIDFGPDKHTASRLVDLTILTADGKTRH